MVVEVTYLQLDGLHGGVFGLGPARKASCRPPFPLLVLPPLPPLLSKETTRDDTEMVAVRGYCREPASQRETAIDGDGDTEGQRKVGEGGVTQWSAQRQRVETSPMGTICAPSPRPGHPQLCTPAWI